MKVKATRPVWLGKTYLAKGESAEVDGRSYGDDHPMVKEGWLVAEKSEPKRKPRPESKTEPATDHVEVETDGHTDT